MKKTLLLAAAVLMLVSLVLSGCSTVNASDTTNSSTEALATEATDGTNSTSLNVTSTSSDSSDTTSTSILSSVEGSILDTSELFTDRDLEQSADLTDAVYMELTSDEDVTITEEGVYVLSGDVTNATVIVEADEEAKVQLVLDGVSIVNEAAPAIYVISADKVFVTLTDSENYLEVSGNYESDSLDAVIFSKTDLVLNGAGSLEIVSAQGNGIVSKDDLKITGGTYSITSATDSIKANDSIRIYDGDITIVSQKDGLHSENDEDSTLGYIYIYDVTLDITAGDDGIQGNAIVQIDGGVINIETATEGIEGTYVQINGSEISIYATDDGINASQKSTYDMVLEINCGIISVTMASGDTDALDSNGDMYINGGTIDITASSSFDYVGTGELNGGTVTVNGETVTELTQSMMGGMSSKQNMGGGKMR